MQIMRVTVDSSSQVKQHAQPEGHVAEAFLFPKLF